MWTKFQLIFNTVKHLKWIQIRYQVFYRLRGKLRIQPRLRAYSAKPRVHIVVGQINTSLFDQLAQHKKKTIEFNFLNLTQEFERDRIDWNFHEYGKLWTYNLNYFEFLLSDQMSCNEGISLMENYIDNWYYLKDGIEPFPISLRTINWIKFLSKHEIKNERIDEKLYQQVQILLNSLEYHILANHLLENAFALIFAAYYFQDEHIYSKAKPLLLDQLEEQILKDGGHYERSPMYHQIMLFRLLDVVSLVKSNPWKSQEILAELQTKAQAMVSWLVSVTLSSGEIPYVKDSAPNIAPKSSELFAYTKSLGLSITECKLLKESGYRWIESGNAKLLIDVGKVSPSYQPGHAHADELNFLLYNNGLPIIVDIGISTYEKDGRRNYERSTQAHNCITIENENSSDVWGGFRVGKRANVVVEIDEPDCVTVHHNGYRDQKIVISRCFICDEQGFKIISEAMSREVVNTISYLHFHPNCKIKHLNFKEIVVDGFRINLTDFYDVSIESYTFNHGFNLRSQGKRLVARSSKTNTIEITHVS